MLTSAQPEVEEVVDLAALRLKNMKQEESVIRLGAMVSLQALVENPRLRKFAGGIIPQSCRSLSVSKMMRNQKTLGGEICGGDAASDLAAVLLALDARVKMVNSIMEEKEWPVAEFWSVPTKRRGRKEAAAQPGLLLEVIIPRPAKGATAAFERIAQIESQPSLMSVAAVIHFDAEKNCAEARIAVGSFAPGARRLGKIESALKGKPLSAESVESACPLGWDEVQLLSDTRASSEYRRAVAPALVRRVLLRCMRGN